LQAIDRLGRWQSFAPGVWQMDQFGNPVLFIRPDGRALMVDPGPCDFMNPLREADFASDLDRFQVERGLRSVDWALDIAGRPGHTGVPYAQRQWCC